MASNAPAGTAARRRIRSIILVASVVVVVTAALIRFVPAQLQLIGPAVANLDPDLLGALRRAAADAATDGIVIVVNSGWRSPEYQERLLRQAIAKYGSKAKAARWVATAETSPHVSGHAVDIGPSRAAKWLARHGAAYGLCQIYRNEPWHYELRPEAIDEGCPPMYADPRYDPRMHQSRRSQHLATSQSVVLVR
jgi:D-alanyl-D-alanine carboxypeptidase